VEVAAANCFGLAPVHRKHRGDAVVIGAVVQGTAAHPSAFLVFLPAASLLIWTRQGIAVFTGVHACLAAAQTAWYGVTKRIFGVNKKAIVLALVFSVNGSFRDLADILQVSAGDVKGAQLIGSDRITALPAYYYGVGTVFSQYLRKALSEKAAAFFVVIGIVAPHKPRTVAYAFAPCRGRCDRAVGRRRDARATLTGVIWPRR